MMKTAGLAVGEGLTLEVNMWQNPTLYILYQIYMRIYFVDYTGEMWSMDQFQGLAVEEHIYHDIYRAKKSL